MCLHPEFVAYWLNKGYTIIGVIGRLRLSSICSYGRYNGWQIAFQLDGTLLVWTDLTPDLSWCSQEKAVRMIRMKAFV
jgi:hypothetical protein